MNDMKMCMALTATEQRDGSTYPHNPTKNQKNIFGHNITWTKVHLRHNPKKHNTTEA